MRSFYYNLGWIIICEIDESQIFHGLVEMTDNKSNQLLYYYTKAEHAFSNINERRIKVSNISELNDTFDVFTPAAKTRSEIALAHNFVNQWSKLFGLVCFSGTWQSPLMWGHYADNHRGVCIGFEVDLDRFHKVEYISQRHDIKYFGKSSFAELDEKALQSMMHFKFDAWSYEAEYRYFVFRREQIKTNRLHFYKFPYWLRPKQFILGSRCKLSSEHRALTNVYQEQGMEVFKVRSAFQTFEMVRNKWWKLSR